VLFGQAGVSARICIFGMRGKAIAGELKFSEHEGVPKPSEPVVTSSGFLSPELLLAAVVDSSDDAIISKDLNGIVTSWNRGAERTFGYTVAEMIGQPILRMIPPDRGDEEPAILERLRRGERMDHFETIRVCKNGKRINVSLTISPIRDASGKIVGASKIARDITEQKVAQERLAEAYAALRRADQMKAEFISTLSHELRTPLNAISGWVQILEEGASQEEISEGLEVIGRNVRIQARLVDDLLDISRIEAGKLSLEIQPVDVRTVISAAVDAVRPAAEAKEVRLTSACSAAAVHVMADKNRLQQVLWNLLANAVKFSKKSGRVQVSSRCVDSHLEISVTDNGIGITPEDLDRVFERFSQADASSTRKHGGLGLGLAIARRLAEMHGGTIAARSEGLGHGSTFVVQLPIPVANSRERTQQAPDDEREPKRASELMGIKILAVDDDRDSAEVVRRILSRCGATVRTAGSMEEALSVFEAFAPDVVVSDIGMPDHDGYELISRVRALPSGRRVAAVALTAFARGEDRARALRAGFQMHVAKPVESAELTAAVLNLAMLRRA
jgi:PAS domain S-box-containing protein